MYIYTAKSGVHLKRGFKYRKNFNHVNRNAEFIYQPNMNEANPYNRRRLF